MLVVQVLSKLRGEEEEVARLEQLLGEISISYHMIILSYHMII